jgi:prepilin-type N-terminal cleavage/methylation domain-containing protein
MTTRKGMTLIEVMLTLAIVSILTVAALRVTVNISRAHGLERAQDSALTLESRLDELLRMDVVHADGCRQLDDGFELRSLSAIDYDSLRLAHLPVTIKYEIRQIAGLSWLVRRQRYQGKMFNELVCSGVYEVSLNSSGTGDKFNDMPREAIIIVKFEEKNNPPLTFTYHTK